MNKINYSLAPLGILPSATNLAPGQVAMANSELMNDTFYSEPLTSYAVGWRSEDGRLEELLRTLAPGRIVLLVSHDEAITDLCDEKIFCQI